MYNVAVSILGCSNILHEFYWVILLDNKEIRTFRSEKLNLKSNFLYKKKRGYVADLE
jgi:hypothetical protein